MRLPALAAALAIALAAAPAYAAPGPSPTATPRPAAGGKATAGKAGGLHIKGVTVDIQPIELAPGMPAGAPEGAHVEQPPALLPFRAVPRRPKASPSPTPKP